MMEFAMSNDELIQAIEHTYEMLNADIFDDSLKEAIINHLKCLLAVQKYRAEAITLPDNTE